MSVAKTLMKKLTGLKAGAVFCANDFCDLGNRGTIDVTLHRIAKSGIIRRLGFGLYDKPRKSTLLGYLTPDIGLIIKAYARRTGQTITLDPMGAANALSLTTQVPAQMIFLTDGKSHVLRVCGVDIKLVHASPKNLAGANTPIGIIIQALRYYSTADLPIQDVKALAKRLSTKDINALKAIRNKTPRQITPQIDRIISHATFH
jgi:hypothetical protein